MRVCYIARSIYFDEAETDELLCKMLVGWTEERGRRYDSHTLQCGIYDTLGLCDSK